MKKLFLCLAGAVAALTLNAKVWRVNYDENAQADFKTIKEACSTTLVSDGDTLYMEPGLHNGSSTDNTISRPLTILGPGWGFQANNGAISAISQASFANSISLKAENITLLGIYAYGISTANNYEHVYNLRIERCKVSHGISVGGSYATCQNVVIRNNFVQGDIYVRSYYAALTHIIIENNIVSNRISGETSCSDKYLIIRHNTIMGYIQDVSQIIAYDNIILGGTADPFTFKTTKSNVQIYNNVLSISQDAYDADLTAVSPKAYSNFPNNIWAGATTKNTFVNQTEGIYFDEAMKYQVRSDSPAKNAATDGTDCGAFGGEHPFVLYGRPEGIPYIYDVEVPAYPTDNKLNISFKVAGQNE